MSLVRHVFQGLVDEKFHIFVLLDTDAPGLVIPPHMKDSPQVQFRVEVGNPANHRDLVDTPDGWCATLTSNGTAMSVFVPWGAIREIIGQTPVSQTVILQSAFSRAADSALGAAGPPGAAAGSPPGGHLRVVK